MQQKQIGGGLLRLRGAEIGGGQGIEMFGEPGLVLPRTEPFPNLRPALDEHIVNGGLRAIAGKVLHVSHAQISACNELNRLSPHGAGVVTGVEAVLRA